MNSPTLLTLGVFAASLLAVFVRPGGLSEATAAMAGAVALLLLGRIPVAGAIQVLWSARQVFLFLGAVLLLAALGERSGFFRWAALWTARACGGSARRLFILLFLLAAAVTALFSLAPRW